MAASSGVQILQNHERNHSKTSNEVSRKEIKAAIDKAVELRALHAALMQGNNPSAPNLRYLSSASPVSLPHHHASHSSAQDYPVFTPSYEDQPLPGFQQIQLDNRTISENDDDDQKTNLTDYKTSNASSRKEIPSELAEDQKSVTGLCAYNTTVLRKSSPRTDFFKSSTRKSTMSDTKSVSSCNSCKNFNIVVPLTDIHSSLQSQQTKNRGLNRSLSWFFPRIKKKNKNENSPSRPESEEVSQQVFREMGILMSVEKLKKELMEANESREAALMEVAMMKSSLGELKHKLEYLETYCEELKNALRQAVPERLIGNLSKRGKWKSDDGIVVGNVEDLMPVSEEVMVEGFLQIVSEARLSVKQFCKSLVSQIEENTDIILMENLNLLLKPHKLSINSRYSKAVLYHLEAIINQSLYQDFENSVFQKNGSPKLLDPREDRQSQFSAFVALRNLSWNQVLKKGTKHYSEDFSKFCDQKMSSIVSVLNWTRAWPQQLLQSFFVAAKCIWLLHLLAFSFNPPLGILRIEENTKFDSQYMDDIFMDRQRLSQGPSRVKIMVMPGFYVQDRVLRCKVLCRYKSLA
ncbi:hypothetical protein ACSBR1_022081 [Camellia fascicularis]